MKKKDEISFGIVKQAKLAIEMAEVIIFVVDGKLGITAADEEVVQVLRKSKKTYFAGC